MNVAALAVVAGLCCAGSAFAQAQPPTAAVPSSPSSDATTKDGKPSAKAVRAACRTSVKSEGLKGAEREKAVSDCFVKQRPDLAAKEKAREECRAEAKATAKDERHDFVKTCVKGKA